MTSEQQPSAPMHYRWRLVSGARTPWEPVPMRYVAIPANAEGVEFHEGVPGLPPRRRAEAPG